MKFKIGDQVRVTTDRFDHGYLPKCRQSGLTGVVFKVVRGWGSLPIHIKYDDETVNDYWKGHTNCYNDSDLELIERDGPW